MTFDELIKKHNWNPIRNCPGRFMLSGAKPDLTPEKLLGSEIEAREFRVDKARDTVVVVKLDQGGLISYRRADGSFLHTLNNAEGFCRKLSQLGIELNQTMKD